MRRALLLCVTLLALPAVAAPQANPIVRDAKDPASGWSALRTLADALMLRCYDPEYLEEMQGIADAAAAAGAAVHGRRARGAVT